MRLDGQALFHPMNYLAGLAELAVRAGVTIHEGSAVVDWESGRPTRADTRHGSVRAEDLVLATHTPPGLVPTVQARMSPLVYQIIPPNRAG